MLKGRKVNRDPRERSDHKVLPGPLARRVRRGRLVQPAQSDLSDLKGHRVKVSSRA